MKRILIIDDEKILSNAMTRALSRGLSADEYVVFQKNSAVEGIQFIESSLAGDFIDLVFLDYLMPELNGGNVLDWIKKNSPQTRVILMTAYGDQATKNDLVARGALQVLSKPFDDIMLLPDLVKKTLQPVG